MRQFVSLPGGRQEAGENLSLFQERNRFSQDATRTEVVAQFVEGTTEACRSFNGSKTAHGIGPLFNTSVVLLQPIIEILTRSMLDVAAHRLAYSTRVGGMAICRHLIRNEANHRNSLLEKPLSRLHVPFFAQHRINQIAIVIDCPIQITPLPMHFQIGFIHIPRLPGLPTSLGSQLLRYQRSKSCFPIAESFMCECQTSCQKHLSHVTQAQFITETPQHSEQDNICRCTFNEQRASPFIKGTATVRAKERGVAQLGFLCSFLRRRYHARGTVHEPTLLVQLCLS